MSGVTGAEENAAQHGSQVNFSGYTDTANQLRDKGAMESLERKIASGQMLTTDEINTYANLSALYPMMRAGALGPVGLSTPLRSMPQIIRARRVVLGAEFGGRLAAAAVMRNLAVVVG